MSYYPPEIILADNIPMLGENVRFFLNEETFEYKATVQIPFTDEVGNIHHLPATFIFPSPCVSLHMADFVTPEDFPARSFKKHKITQLKELISKIENLK